MPRETDRLAAHEVDLAVARVAVPFAGVREAPTWAVADRLDREVVAAALVRQRYTKQRPNR